MKQASLLFMLAVVGTVVGNRVDDVLTRSAVPLLNYAPVAIYYLVVVIVSGMILVGLVLIGIGVGRGALKFYSNGEFRAELIEKVRAWPSSKWDALVMAGVAYFIGYITLLLSAAAVLPRGSLSGAVTPEQVSSIMVFALLPLVAVYLVLMCRWTVEGYRQVKMTWATGTRRNKTVMLSSLIFALFLLAVLAGGQFAGWNQAV